MTQKYLLLSVVFLFAVQLHAQEMKLVANHATQIGIKNTTSNYVSVKKVVNTIAYEDFSALQAILMKEKDAPELPMYSESVIVPNGAVSIQVAYDSYVEFDNTSILPSKGSLKRNVNPADVPYQFGAAYTNNDFYPGHLAQLANPYIFRNTRGATVTFYPFQYNPVTQKLRVYKNITVTVLTDVNQTGMNDRQNTATEKTDVFQALYANQYLNAAAYVPVQDEGEMLIITPNAFVTVLQPFVNWKNEKGMKTTVATLSETGNTPAAIQDYIKTSYQNNMNLVYVQLVGDHENLPCYTYGLSGSEQLWSDSYYGQMDGTDSYPELLVGRFSGNVSEVQNMVSRVIEYETNPMVGDWMTKAIGIGSNEGDGYGDDGEPDWQHLRNIGDKLSTYGYSNIYEFYDGSHGLNDADESPSSAMITEAINTGSGLLNYTGHGWTEGVSTGNYTNSSVNTLTNNGQYPFVISVACNNGTFVGATSLCESFTRRIYNNTPAGAIASCGSSILMAWAEPMQTQDEMTELIVHSNIENTKTTLGGLFYNGQLSMLEAYNQSNTAEEVMQTWVFFGDASTVFRSKVTTDILSEHAPTIGPEGGNFMVTSDTNDALVAITQDNQILGTGMVYEGVCTINLPELLSENPLNVTLTKPNARPYRGQVAVSALGVSNFESQFAIYPNPASDVIHMLNKGNNLNQANLQIVDVNGRILWSVQKAPIGTDYSIPVGALSSGMYLLNISDGTLKTTRKFIIE